MPVCLSFIKLITDQVFAVYLLLLWSVVQPALSFFFFFSAADWKCITECRNEGHKPGGVW